MVIVKRKGIVARPGVHHNGRTGQDEVVSWEELKEAARFQSIIPLVLKHPETGYINPSDRIGTVKQTINEKEQIIEGEFWFFDEPEYWGQIPVELKRKIVGGIEIPLSAGYKVGSVIGGKQTCRQYDHIALDVTNPMFRDVGITQGDVRMETKYPDEFRIEETPSIDGEKQAEPAKKGPPAEPKPIEDKDFWVNYGRMQARLEQLEKQVQQQNTVAVEKAPVEEATEGTEQEQEATPPPAPPKPKTVVPQGSPKKSDLDDDGLFVFSSG